MKPTDLRGILQYIPKFRDRIFVISVDGAIVSDENFANLLLDFAVLRSLNIRVALVHGAASQIAALAAERERCAMLAIFMEDERIDLDLLRRLWRVDEAEAVETVVLLAER